MPNKSAFEAPLQREPLDNPDWTREQNDLWDRLDKQGRRSASEIREEVEKLQSGESRLPGGETKVTANHPESIGDRVGEFVAQTGAELDIADGDRSVQEAREQEAALRIVVSEPESEEERRIRSAELNEKIARYGTSGTHQDPS